MSEPEHSRLWDTLRWNGYTEWYFNYENNPEAATDPGTAWVDGFQAGVDAVRELFDTADYYEAKPHKASSDLIIALEEMDR